jgi:hypothetical protein
MTEQELEELMALRQALMSVRPQAQQAEQSARPVSRVSVPPPEYPMQRAPVDVPTLKPIQHEGKLRYQAPSGAIVGDDGFFDISHLPEDQQKKFFEGSRQNMPFGVESGQTTDEAFRQKMIQERQRMGRAPQSFNESFRFENPIEVEGEFDPGQPPVLGGEGIDEDIAALPKEEGAKEAGPSMLNKFGESMEEAFSSDEAADELARQERMRMNTRQLPQINTRQNTTTPQLDDLMRRARGIVSRY